MVRFALKNLHFLLLLAIIFSLYYKFFLFGKIPFPGDLLVGSYSPWFDYYKIPVQNPIISDVFSQLFLWKYLSIDIFKTGQWPLWNPYSFTGTPLLANYQSATLYPLNILLLLPKYYGWGIFIFSQTLIAAIGIYLLLTLWITSKLARLTGAVIFALGGLMTTWLETGVAGHAIIWLPFSLYFTKRYLLTPKIRYLLLLTLSLACSLLAGHVQIATFSLIILFNFAFINSWNKNINQFFTSFLPVILSLTLSLLICSIQLLPSLDLLGKSIRLTESYTGEFNHGLLPVKELMKFFIADFFGNTVSRNYWGFLNYFETSGFFGSLTLPLLIFSFFYLKKTKTTIFFLLILLFSIVFSFSNPLSQTIYSVKIPLLTSSYASRMLFITLFSVACLSAFSINQVMTVPNQEKNFFKSTIWAWASLVGVLVGSIISYQISDSSTILVSIRNSIIPVLITSVFLVAFLLVRKKRLIVTLLFVLIALDLGRYFLKFNPFISQKLIFPEVPTIQFLQKQPGVFRVGREHAEVLPPNTWTAYNLQSYEGYDPVYLNEYGKFINFLNGNDLRVGNSSRYAEINGNYKSSFLDAANAKYFIAILRDKNNQIPGDLINDKFIQSNYKLIFKDRSSAVLENPNALPRAYFAPALKVADLAESENILMTNKEFDPRKTILISKDLHLASVTGKGNAEIINYSPNMVKIKTTTNQDELLVLADQFDDGWKAKIDNRETEVARANLVFRAIKVPAGKHEILFYYWPQVFDLGLKITIATAIVIALIILKAII